MPQLIRFKVLRDTWKEVYSGLVYYENGEPAYRVILQVRDERGNWIDVPEYVDDRTP